MKVLVITGSPRKNGTSYLVTEEFLRGLQAGGHTVRRFDIGSGEIHPCIACDHCLSHDGACIFEDRMAELGPAILEADLLVFATPLYYFGLPAQLKAAIDRLYAINDALLAAPKKAVLLATCGDEEDWVWEALRLHFATICRYLHWEICGEVLISGVYQRTDLEGDARLEEAFRLGSSL